MFDNVILDVTIGIIFIFLLYSLLATSIQEAIATGFALRARTLKEGIINGMLCNTPNMSRLESFLKGIWVFFEDVLYLIHKPTVKNKKLGHYLYDHPLIKNYGSSRIFDIPSYLPKENFSTILVDVLKQDFDNKLDAIIERKLEGLNYESGDQVRESLRHSADAVKIKELLGYYSFFYGKGETIPTGVTAVIEKDTWQILQMHLRNSFYNFDDFVRKVETWYDDSMDRISGWYKRKVQVLLFVIGISLAVIFNIDIIEIAGKLSTDKDARDQIVQLAIKEAETYKNDPRVQKASGIVAIDSISADSAVALYQRHIKEAKATIDGSIVSGNQVLALGWGDYGRSRDSLETLKAFFLKQKDRGAEADREQTDSEILDAIYGHNWVRIKYVLAETFEWRKMAGFLLTAFAICLGAPFWFDLLNKVVNVRASGKREENNNSSGSAAGVAPPSQSVNLNMGNQQTGEEAVG